jgi:alpha-L-arabinofuranosidase
LNTSCSGQELGIHLLGTTPAPDGGLIMLCADNTEATNTINRATSIMPVDSALGVPGDTLHYKAPAYSIQVLALNLR